MLCLLNIDRSLLSNILAWLADCSNVAAAALIVVSTSHVIGNGILAYMSVAQYVSFQTQIKLPDSLATAIGDMYVNEDAAATNPYLSVKARS